MIQYPFTAYPLIAVVSLMFLLPATFYLLWLRPKTTATYNLIGFLLCSAVSLTAMYVYNAIYFALTPLWAAQDAALIVGAVFLARFAYTFPKEERSAEARWVVGFFALLAAWAVGWALIDVWHFAQNPHDFEIATSFWFLMPATIPLLTGVFLRRMMAFAPLAPQPKSDPESQTLPTGKLWVWLIRLWQVLRNPPNREAVAHRAFALAVLSGLIQAFGSIFYFLLIPGESWIALGTLATLALLLLAYLNATASANSLIVRMVGATLIVFLALMGMVGAQVIQTTHQSYWRSQLRLVDVLRQALQSGDTINYPDTLVYLARYPVPDSAEPGSIEFVYENTNAPDFDLQRIQNEIQLRPLSEAFASSGYETVIRIDPYPAGRGKNYMGFLYRHAESVLELGFVYTGRNGESHALVSRLIWLVVLGTIVILIFLPLVFRASLIVPLQHLLQGVQRVNSGDLAVYVPIRIEDEIGFLTRSFNGMTRSLHELTEGLEQKVEERTQSLRSEIVERERVQTELEIATQRAEEANRAKSIFLANMSHELRTPLNAILGYAQFLQQQVPDADRPASIIERSGRHLLSLINGVLDLARIEAGKMELAPEPVDLTEFLQRVSDLASIQAQAKGLTFRVETQLESNAAALIDSTRLRQILLNLLSNAVSYTDAGEVVLRVVQEPTRPDDGVGRFHFSVTDSGLGIDPQDQFLLFHPMYQTDQARQRGSGTGLGLSISDQFVRLMGGQIQVESQLGQGSTFSFSLDLTLCASPAERSPSRRRQWVREPAPRILVIDDNQGNRELVADVLRPLGFVVEGMDAQQGLQAALTTPFDLIITDLLMPDLSGFDLMRALRANTATATIPIIATSASVYPQDKARSIEAGADAFVDKPVSFPLLLDLLDQLLDLQWQSESGPTTPAPANAGLEPDALPSAHAIEQLLRCAHAGDIVALKQLAQEIDGQMTHTRFADQLHLLINAFQLEKMIEWLEGLPRPSEVRSQ